MPETCISACISNYITQFPVVSNYFCIPYITCFWGLSPSKTFWRGDVTEVCGMGFQIYTRDHTLCNGDWVPKSCYCLRKIPVGQNHSLIRVNVTKVSVFEAVLFEVVQFAQYLIWFKNMVQLGKNGHIHLSPHVFSMVESRELKIHGKIKFLNMPTKFWTVIILNLPFLKIIIVWK